MIRAIKVKICLAVLLMSLFLPKQAKADFATMPIAIGVFVGLVISEFNNHRNEPNKEAEDQCEKGEEGENESENNKESSAIAN